MENTTAIYLRFGKKLKIPVNPETIEIKYPSNDKEYDVLGVGKVTVQRRPGLKEVSWESFFPGDRSAPYVNTQSRKPGEYVKQIEKAMKNKQKGRLIISRSGLYDTNMRCTIDEFKTKDKGGEPGDIYYSITLKEYRNFSPQTVSIVTQPATQDTPTVQASADTGTDRAVETPVLRVGASVVVNGEYCYDSTGSKPHGTANNLSTTVTRIVSGAAYPVQVGSYGWVAESQLQITG